MSDYRIETKCVQGGYTPGNGEPRQIPIVQSTTFKYATSEDMGSSLTWSQRLLLYPPAKSHQTTPWRPRSPSWRAAPPPC